MSLDLSSITFSSIMAGFVFGVIGLSAFRHGKRLGNIPVIGLGLALMIYPYFTHGPWADWGVGVLLCGWVYFFWNR